MTDNFEFCFPDASRKMKPSNGRNKKRKVTIANAYAKGRKQTAKNPSFGTMPTSESAKKDTEKSTAAVINQALLCRPSAVRKGSKATTIEATFSSLSIKMAKKHIISIKIHYHPSSCFLFALDVATKH